MKKGAVILGLILIFISAGFPFIKGLALERVVRQSVGDINLTYANSDQDVAIEIQAYDRKYADSIIEWKLHLGSFKDVLGVEEIIFLDHVEHGYSNGYSKIISSTSLEKNYWFKNFQTLFVDGKNPVTIKTMYGFSGDIESRIELAGFSIKKEKNEILINPGVFNIFFKKELHQILAQCNWGGVVVSEKQHLTGVRFTSQMDKASEHMWGGTASLAIDSIAAGDGNHFFDIKKLSMDYSRGYQKDPSTFSIGVILGMAQLESSQMDIKDAILHFDIKHLDAKGFEELNAWNAHMRSQLIEKVVALKDDPNAMTKEIERQIKILGREMMGQLEKFLRQGLEISLGNLHAQVPQGEISADIVLGLKKRMTLPGFLPILMSPSYAMDIFSLKSDIQIPYTLVGYQHRLLAPLIPGMQTGLFIAEGKNLVHKARTRNGKLFLNQKEVVLE